MTAMKKLVESDLLSLERYSRERADFRARVIAHKKNRQLKVGPNTMWLFEDRLTVHYQVQEMLRAERIFEAEGIAEELEAYNPLIPDGSNWKATMLIEYEDVSERQAALARLKGIEDKVWVQVESAPRVYAIADEDLERENESKTSSVHFLRFELDAASKQALRGGAALTMGVEHPAYRATEQVGPSVRDSLLKDLSF
jgi:hypothetical protein